MKRAILAGMVAALLGTLIVASAAGAQEALTFDTGEGTLTVHTVGHGSLYFIYRDQVIHVDPYARVADYVALPKADQIWITHDHGDHLDLSAIDAVATAETLIIADGRSAERLAGRNVVVLQNGERHTAGGVTVEAVPAYNLVRERAPGQKYHPKGDYNGYVGNFGSFRVYIAGDTECFPEMRDLGAIDLAFIPINLPFTMTPEEAVGCIKVIAPKVVVPYHQGDSDPNVVAEGLKGSGIEVIVRPLP